MVEDEWGAVADLIIEVSHFEGKSMFQINKDKNILTRLESKSFSELNIREREHLQEWFANMPDALGEELLIIQKEFDGFAETRERLDLLALDKDGQLVIIENKLDDSGRDVVWQALKYTAYCSNLKKSEIIDIFQQYLDRYRDGGNATSQICEFLDAQEIDEVVLNSGNSQRIILVAANFRKEVTATALWLLSHEIQVQCFKVTPFTFKEELLLDVQQIIPMPDAEEFMIGMTSKDVEEKTVRGVVRNSHKLRLEFWEQALDVLSESNVLLYQNISPSKDHWLSAGSGLRSCPYHLIFGKNEVRVEISLSRSERSENKWIFDKLIGQKDELEKAFGDSFCWERLDSGKASRIKYAKSFDGYQQENWPEMIAWLVKHIKLLEITFKKPLQQANQSLKVTSVKNQQ